MPQKGGLAAVAALLRGRDDSEQTGEVVRTSICANTLYANTAGCTQTTPAVRLALNT